MKFYQLMFSFFFLFSEAYAQSPWGLDLDEENIKILTRSVENSSYLEVRGNTTLNVKLETILNLFMKPEGYKDWVTDTIESKLVKKTENPYEFYFYLLTKIPWPFKNRDGITEFKLRRLPNDQGVIVILEGKQKMLPDNKDIVRLETFLGIWSLFKSKYKKDVWTMDIRMFAEPGGWLSSAFVNFMVSSIQFGTMKKLKELALKGKSKKSTQLSLGAKSLKKPSLVKVKDEKTGKAFTYDDIPLLTNTDFPSPLFKKFNIIDLSQPGALIYED